MKILSHGIAALGVVVACWPGLVALGQTAPLPADSYAYEATAGSESAGAPEATVDEATEPVLDYNEAADLNFEYAALEGGADKCNEKKMKELDKAVATAHKPLFFDNKFDYLCDECYCDWHPGDNLKRLCLGDCFTLDIGGQYRARLHNERNFRGLGLTGNDDDFLLHRTRLYGNLEIGSRARAYVEFIDADSNYENFAPRGIEVDRADILNLFGDLKVYDQCDREAWVRVGRQELLYGAQRFISPLDFANTRRTFEGLNVLYKGTDWNVDAFWTRPVIVDPVHFNSADQTREFMGAYGSLKSLKNEKFDVYGLRYLDVAGPLTFELNTLGSRYEGSQDSWLWDVEGAYQWGDVNAAGHDSFMYTLGVGRKFECHCWKPTAWMYFDWAEGDAPVNNAFHEKFPLGHRYLGFMDLFSRRNIEDLNFLVTAKPSEKLTLLLWYHIFHLQDADNDVPYNVNQTPFVATPGGSGDLGHELDLLVKYDISARMNVQFGYSHFFAGDWYATNPTPPPFVGDADFYYTEFTFNF